MTRTYPPSSLVLRTCSALAAAIILLCATGLAEAQGYPVGPVRVIVPFPPGGGVDTMGRIITRKLSAGLGKPFPVENRSGANGNIGTEIAAKAAKDGYTLLFTGAGLVTNPSLYARTGYDPVRDFDPVSLISLAPNLLVVHPSLPVRSVKELVALAKARPGEILGLLNARITRIVHSAEMKRRLTGDGLVPVGSTREQFAAHIRTEIAKWSKVIKTSGAKVN